MRSINKWVFVYFLPCRLAITWFSLSSLVVIWDALFVFLRPRSLPGGDLHFLFKPCMFYTYTYLWLVRSKIDKLRPPKNFGIIVWNKLSIIDIGLTVLFNYPPQNSTIFGLIMGSFSYHNLNFVDPISTILWFSESLERDLSNGIIKVHIFEL